MPTIFITIPWFHPAFKAGGPVQSISNMVNELREGYQFFIFCGDTDLNGLPITIRSSNEWVPYNDHTKVWYARKKHRSQQLKEQVKIIQPDIVYMVGFFSWHFTLVPLLFTKVPQKILSVRGMLHLGALRQKSWKKELYIRFIKLTGKHKRCVFQASDTTEAGFIKAAMGENVQVKVAGNFPKMHGAFQLPIKQPGELTLISIALISPMKNTLLVLQALAGCSTNIQYSICGPVKELGYWEECQAAISLLPPHIKVTYHKELPPSEVPTMLQQAQVTIIPSKSENFGHSIIEALSAGMPVITSNNTPWNGLESVKAGLNVVTDVTALAAAIEYFAAMDSTTYNQWRKGSLEYSTSQLDWEQLRVDYGELFGLD
jgi:glycosyltransferase involved in cell wall biosynthesis